MHTFTALYDRRADAEAMQAELERLGIIDLNHDLHSDQSEGFDRDAYSDQARPGLWGKRKGAAPPSEERHLYEEALRRGGFLLTVDCDDAEAARVHQLLESSSAVDMVDRERELRSSGFAPPVAAAAPLAAVAAERDLSRSAQHAEAVIPVMEERLTVGTRQVERGGVRVRAYVVEEPVREAVALREERVEVERRPVQARAVDAGDVFQERDIELTETAEELVVSKEARVVEEIALRKEAAERVETVQDTVRHTEVEVEDLGATPPRRA